MAKFLLLEERDRIRLFKDVREKTGISFNKLPSFLGISRTSFFNYYSKGLPLPVEIFKKLQKISKIKIKNYQELEKKRFSRNFAKIPPLGEALAEIIGAINGDGHLSEQNYEVNIVSDVREKNYQIYLKGLFKELFGLEPSLNKMRNSAIKLRVYSQDIHNHLSIEYGLPIGKKKGNLAIPQKIKKSKKLLKTYLRGVFDTDGSFYLRRNHEPVIQITSADKRFLTELKESLEFLEFNVSKGDQRIFVYGESQAIKFFKSIKPANHKHLKKFENFSNL